MDMQVCVCVWVNLQLLTHCTTVACVAADDVHDVDNDYDDELKSQSQMQDIKQ